MKIAFLGGSFNPVHNAHIKVALEAADSFGLDKVYFVPSAVSPHKVNKEMACNEHRLEMLRCACLVDSRLGVEDCELNRGGVSYTCDTVDYIYSKYADVLEGKPYLILGQDLFSGFHLWKKAEYISEKCNLILACRPKEDNNSTHSNSAVGDYAFVEDSDLFKIEQEPLFKNALVMHNDPVKISSTTIRNMAAEGKDFSNLVPAEVFNYIVSGSIYGSNK